MQTTYGRELLVDKEQTLGIYKLRGGYIFGPLDLHKINATSMFYVIDLLHNAQILMRFGKAFSTFVIT